MWAATETRIGSERIGGKGVLAVPPVWQPWHPRMSRRPYHPERGWSTYSRKKSCGCQLRWGAEERLDAQALSDRRPADIGREGLCRRELLLERLDADGQASDDTASVSPTDRGTRGSAKLDQQLAVAEWDLRDTFVVEVVVGDVRLEQLLDGAMLGCGDRLEAVEDPIDDCLIVECLHETVQHGHGFWGGDASKSVKAGEGHFLPAHGDGADRPTTRLPQAPLGHLLQEPRSPRPSEQGARPHGAPGEIAVAVQEQVLPLPTHREWHRRRRAEELEERPDQFVGAIYRFEQLPCLPLPLRRWRPAGGSEVPEKGVDSISPRELPERLEHRHTEAIDCLDRLGLDDEVRRPSTQLGDIGRRSVSRSWSLFGGFWCSRLSFRYRYHNRRSDMRVA